MPLPWRAVLVRGEAVRERGWGHMGNPFLLSFCHKPETALKSLSPKKHPRRFSVGVVWGQHFDNCVCIHIFMYLRRCC